MWADAAEFLRDGRVASLLKWPTADQTEILDLVKKRPYYQFRLLACEIWLRTRFDGERPDRIAERLISYGRASPPAGIAARQNSR